MVFDWPTFIIGLLAQLLFFARTLVQWILSEKAKRVVSPTWFWILGLFGSFLLGLYGCLREDFTIVFGQCILYYIYWWNLKILGVWGKIPSVIRFILCVTLIVFAVLILCNTPMQTGYFFKDTQIPLWLLVWGTMGQLLFASRFIVQWIYSYYIGRSVLPIVFWIISLVGSSMIFLYGIIRFDMVLILGHSCGIVIYIRNLYIEYSHKKELKQ